MRAAATSGNTEERGLPSRDKDVAAFLAPEDIFHAKRGSAASLHRPRSLVPCSTPKAICSSATKEKLGSESLSARGNPQRCLTGIQISTSPNPASTSNFSP